MGSTETDHRINGHLICDSSVRKMFFTISGAQDTGYPCERKVNPIPPWIVNKVSFSWILDLIVTGKL